MVCKAEFCEMDVWKSLIASFKAAGSQTECGGPCVTVLGAVDAPAGWRRAGAAEVARWRRRRLPPARSPVELDHRRRWVMEIPLCYGLLSRRFRPSVVSAPPLLLRLLLLPMLLPHLHHASVRSCKAVLTSRCLAMAAACVTAS